MDKRHRSPIIEGNPTLDKIAHRFQAKLRKLERIKAARTKEIADLKRAGKP